MSFQGKMTGNQVGKLFASYNDQEGSAVVDLSRNYNTGDKYSSHIGNGNQIDLALKEINTYRGDDVFGLDHLDWSNGLQMKAVFAKLILLVGAGDNAPIWLSSLPLEVTIVQGSAWPFACASHSWSSLSMTYGNNLNLPTGITLESTGVFSGTASSISAGTLELIATNANGDTLSEWIKWTVVSAAVMSTEVVEEKKEESKSTSIKKTKKSKKTKSKLEI